MRRLLKVIVEWRWTLLVCFSCRGRPNGPKCMRRSCCFSDYNIIQRERIERTHDSPPRHTIRFTFCTANNIIQKSKTTESEEPSAVCCYVPHHKHSFRPEETSRARNFQQQNPPSLKFASFFSVLTWLLLLLSLATIPTGNYREQQCK